MIIETLQHIDLQKPAELSVYARAYQYDPTRTSSLRNAFVSALNHRFRNLRGVIRRAIIDQDCFGLKQNTTGVAITAQQLSPPPPGAFAFPRSQDKVSAFMQWMRRQIDKELLEVVTIPQIGTAVEQPWTNLYVQDSYKRGVIRARYELNAAGFQVPSLSTTGGIEASMSTPFHMDRVGLLYTRVYEELQGITSAMDQQISRVLSEGMMNGDGPALLARKINATIAGKNLGELGIGRFIPAQRRAQIMARTEVIRAHHRAMVQEYRNWAVEGVYVKAEFRTAGDKRVCDECQSYEGKRVYTLDEIEGLIPIHPQCRCIALPYREGKDILRK